MVAYDFSDLPAEGLIDWGDKPDCLAPRTTVLHGRVLCINITFVLSGPEPFGIAFPPRAVYLLSKYIPRELCVQTLPLAQGFQATSGYGS